jgi:hypothetical protein
VNSTSRQTDAEDIVRRQLDAYNARNVDAFMANWAEDAQYFQFPSTLLASGAAAIRERHVTRFKEENLFGRLLKRMVMGNLVIDQETVTRTFPDGPGKVDVIAIYEVENGKIAKAWFKMGDPVLDSET